MSGPEIVKALVEPWTHDKAMKAAKAWPFWTPLDVWWMRERMLEALLDDPDDGGRG